MVREDIILLYNYERSTQPHVVTCTKMLTLLLFLNFELRHHYIQCCKTILLLGQAANPRNAVGAENLPNRFAHG